MKALAIDVGVRAACQHLGASRATIARHAKPRPLRGASSSQPSHRALREDERQAILDLAHSERFADFSAREIYATLLDEGVYIGSISTWYRVLRAAGETRERRHLATHPARVKPELAAHAPNQVWSWDITKLLGPQKWTYFQLYAVLDVFSRFVVAWRVEARESAVLAEEMFADAFARESVDTTRLTVHADGGSAMTAKSLAHFFADLGVVKSRSRPHVSNDNPFSEAQFKTLKYAPSFPGSFANLQQARDFCATFFQWYNNQHRHVGIALLTPHDVHHGLADQRRDERRTTMKLAYDRNPQRFVRGAPEPPALAPVAYINQPVPEFEAA